MGASAPTGRLMDPPLGALVPSMHKPLVGLYTNTCCHMWLIVSFLHHRQDRCILKISNMIQTYIKVVQKQKRWNLSKWNFIYLNFWTNFLWFKSYWYKNKRTRPFFMSILRVLSSLRFPDGGIDNYRPSIFTFSSVFSNYSCMSIGLALKCFNF